MLKIRILGVGKDKERWVAEACAHYVKLLSRFAQVEFDYVPSPKASASLSPAEIREAEAARLIPRLERGLIIALCDGGRRVDSRAFAGLLGKWQTTSGGRMTFVIGGPYGLSEDLIGATSFSLSLSPLTFSHQIVRPVLLEQLYRGFTILHGGHYHK